MKEYTKPVLDIIHLTPEEGFACYGGSHTTPGGSIGIIIPQPPHTIPTWEEIWELIFGKKKHHHH